MPSSLSFVIYAPRYRANSGGAIVTHKLCDLLNRQGHSSTVWPLWKPRNLSTGLTNPRRTFAYFGSRLLRGKYSTRSGYQTPLATEANLVDSIVVYPEIVDGNPLHAKRYVRWLLHEPGFHAGRFKYQMNDLYFCYQEAFNKYCDGMIFGGTLTVFEVLLDIYQQTNFGPRTQVGYMIRKGKDRNDLPNLRNKWVLDGLDHAALARAFNECRICYFYDTYTAYAAYAAACGCIPVIVPTLGVSRDQWVPEEAGRLGLAYGEEDIPRALATREAMLGRMRAVEQQNIESVDHFVSTVRAHFAIHG